METVDRLKGMVVMTDLEEIEEGDRLFYELGHYVTESSILDPFKPFKEEDWLRIGKFKEILNVAEFKKNLKEELKIKGTEQFNRYCNHHNFMLIKK